MPIDPVKIPQNVYIEDRVVGPLSLRQIIIMALGGGFSYMLYASVDKAYGSVSIPVAVVLWIPAALAAAFALVKINDLSLMRICFLMLEKMNKPGIRTWTPRTGISINIRTSSKNADGKPKIEPKKEDTHKEIRSLSSMVDQGVPSAVVTQENRIHDVKELTLTMEGLPAPEAPASPTLPPASDLSVFRDVLPPNA